MANVYMEPHEDDETLLPTVSDDSEGEVVPSKTISKKRIIGCMVGLALVGVALVAVLSGKNGASLRNGNVGAAVQFDEKTKASTSLFIIKHTWEKASDAKLWWGNMKPMFSDPKAMKGWADKVAAQGFFNVFFIPTALEGPFYCVWEAKAGKTKKDMEDFINKNELSPALNTTNDVMPIPLELTGGGLPEGISDYFSPSSERKLGAVGSSFYIIEHTFKSDDDVKPTWAKWKEMKADPKGMKKWNAAVAEKGFHNTFFLPTQLKGPIYCIWEAKAGMEKKDMEDFINKNELSPALPFQNTVMPIPLELTGGKAPFKPVFKTSES